MSGIGKPAPRWSRPTSSSSLCALAAVEAAGMTVEDAQVVGEDEGEDRIVAILWVTATKRE